MGQTVNLLAYAFGGSNPSLPTTPVSYTHLAKIGISRVTVVGDTRFDRVLQIREEAKHLPLVELFKRCV